MNHLHNLYSPKPPSMMLDTKLANWLIDSCLLKLALLSISLFHRFTSSLWNKKSYFACWTRFKSLVWNLPWSPSSSHQQLVVILSFAFMAPWEHLCYGTWLCSVSVQWLAVSLIRLGEFWRQGLWLIHLCSYNRAQSLAHSKSYKKYLIWMNKIVLMKEGIHELALKEKWAAQGKLLTPWISTHLWNERVGQDHDWDPFPFRPSVIHDKRWEWEPTSFYDFQKAMLGKK